MASLGNPKTWIPYMNSKDCSQGFCSLYCPQWCYVIYPPPPPFAFPDDTSSPNFSPLVIAIIAILASAFLLVSYYTVISKYCGNPDSVRRQNDDPNDELEDNHNPSHHEPWNVPTTGLDEALIKSITVCTYKKGDGLVEVTDCSVCLSEFQDDESIRLLPKCSHAFHLPCIDKWLKSHLNCPLCRANVFSFGASPLQLPAPVIEVPSMNETVPESQHTSENEAVGRDNERGDTEEERVHNGVVPKPALRAFSDLGNLQGRDAIIEIRDEGYQSTRRSVSMDYSFQSHLSVADILHMNQDEDVQIDQNDAESSKHSQGETSKSNSKRRALHCVLTPTAMKRSFSSGRLFLTRHGRGRQTILPV
ncbi:putative Ring finger protein [Quillaja saponaria]|uniref:RING-type E3 ubiquitin transferase n=1 Tax=Quillaja saponaria TaxID=32244 RepID=A0AAD7KRB9_QUISA|nr:putative Ring finger protein [Quillaja saponaria]